MTAIILIAGCIGAGFCVGYAIGYLGRRIGRF